MKKKLLFVINPISGGRRKSQFPKKLAEYLDHERFDYEIFWWEEVNSLDPALSNFVQNGGDAIIAVGGDGTINHIAKFIVTKSPSIKLGIIPQGSGNGLSRGIQIPMRVHKAIEVINRFKTASLDIGLMNNRVFSNVAGCGFDALVTHSFAVSKKRGFWSYAKSIYSQFKYTRNLTVHIGVEGESIEHQAFIVSIANGVQWGNNFFVAPDASYNDGELDIVLVNKPKLYQVFGLVKALYFRKETSLIRRLRCKQVIIRMERPVCTHYDGEPAGKEKVLEVKLAANPVQVIC